VGQAATTTTLAGPASFPQGTGIFTARVAVQPPGTATLSGTVSFSINGALNPGCQNLSLNKSGEAGCAVTQEPGSYRIAAVYSGERLLLGSSDGMGFTVTSNPNLLLSLNAASFQNSATASAEIVSLFGSKLAAQAAGATDSTLPVTLAGSSVQVRDSAGVARMAQLIYASPSQINCILPSGMATGAATLAVLSSGSTMASTAINIAAVAPGLFSANASGAGVAAANVLRVRPDGTTSSRDAAVFDAVQGVMVALPIDLSPRGDSVYLTLYGTGIRGANGISTVNVTIGSVAVPVLYAGSVDAYPGLDQVNVGPLPMELRGAGEVALSMTILGRTANQVSLTFQ
jgi:uncharacterized protein (TIGR03437 family)